MSRMEGKEMREGRKGVRKDAKKEKEGGGNERKGGIMRVGPRKKSEVTRGGKWSETRWGRGGGGGTFLQMV